MKLSLLNIPGELSDIESDHPPLGLGYIASYLKKYHGNVDIEISSTLDDVIKFKPDLIGITGYTQSFNIVEDVCANLKQHLDIPIILGGHHISAIPHTLPESCDIGVIGEGEETMLQLLRNYEEFGCLKNNLSDIKGIVFKNDDFVITEKREPIEPLDKIPYPSRDLLNIRTQQTHIMTSRGCPYRCTYCSSCIFWDKVRMFSPEYVVDEIEILIENYNIKHIYIYDDIFVLNEKRVQKISELIEKKGINAKVAFSIQARVNLISDNICKYLKKMNVTSIGFGFESGSDDVLKKLKGGNISVSQNENAIRLCEKYGFGVFGPFIIGTPDETKDDVLKSIEFFKSHPLESTEIFIATPLPGTQFWDYALDKGLVNYEMDWSVLNPYISDPLQILNRNIILSEKLSKNELYELYIKFKSEIGDKSALS